MSPSNADIVRDQYEATNARDWERVMSHYSDDVVLCVDWGDIRDGTYSGIEEVGRWFGDWLGTFDDAHFAITELTELPGGHVLVIADHSARGRTSGVEVETEVIWLIRLRDGKMVRVEGHRTRDAAVAAAA